MRDMPDAAKEQYLRTHLEARYGMRVVSLRRLDRGVFAVELSDRRRWIVRVFSTRRPVEQVEGDAAILRFLEQHSFPAERCAAAHPVSVLAGRGILVTEHIEGTGPDPSERTAAALGKLLGRLNLLPVEDGAVVREAGALHHYAPGGGGPQTELAAASAWLEAIEDRVPAQGRALYESLREQVAGADDGHDLPEAFIHPDPGLKNVLATSSDELALIDWTGSGRGPRLAALAILVWSCALAKGSWSPTRVDAVAAGYRSLVRLEQRELARFGAVMRIRPLVFACWRYRHAVMADNLPDGTEWWWPSDALSQAVAARACAALQN